MDAEGYERLADVLLRAYGQAAYGKGKERHAQEQPFHEQPMQQVIRLHGVGFATGQASKKSSEALRLPTTERKVAELLGAINYLAGAVIALEDEERKSKSKVGSIKKSDKSVEACSNHGSWHPWSGHNGTVHRPPLHDNVIVEIKLRDGEEGTGFVGDLVWKHRGTPSDIVAYRVRK